MPGLPLSRFNSSDKTGLLMCVTEKHSKDDIDHLFDLVQKEA